MNNKKIKQTLKLIEIIKDATILTSTGEKIFFSAIQINQTGIFIGKIGFAEVFVETLGIVLMMIPMDISMM